MKIRRPTESDVLCFSVVTRSRATVRRHYAAYRERNGIPIRCDNESCRYWTAELVWNEQPLPLVLDHISGNSLDNSPQNLRLLCPNCDAQLPTRGGKNAGRIVNVTDSGYEIRQNGERRDAKVFPPGVAVAGEAGHVTPSESNSD